jgi:hypothetical protein
MKIFLIVSALLAWLFGAALLFASAAFLAPMGIQATPAVAVSAQAQGAILIGLGVINWRARNLHGSAAEPVLAGNFVVQLLSLIVIGRAILLGIVPPQNAGAVVIHVLLGTGFMYFLAAERRRTIAADVQVSAPRSRQG